MQEATENTSEKFEVDYDSQRWQMTKRSSFREIGALNTYTQFILPENNGMGAKISLTITCRSDLNHNVFVDQLASFLAGRI